MVSYYYLVRLSIFLVCIFSTQAMGGIKDKSILGQYVRSNDGAFSYHSVSTIPLSGSTAHIYGMTSQNWLNASEVNHSQWVHRVSMVVPDNLTSNKAIIFIFGGENSADYLTPDAEKLKILAAYASLTGTVAIEVSQVPNQPLIFADEPSDGRVEDDLVAYSFDTAMGLNDYTRAAYLPMTKAVVKTMDVVQLIADDLKLDKKPKQFVLAGFSKRGAITWLTAAVDDRVCAISPGVYDTLNFIPTIENQRTTYGTFNVALSDYGERKVLDRLRIREGKELTKVVDPFSYRHLIKIPKLIINASGDEFYPPDSSLNYIDTLEGETLLRYVANTDHGGSNNGFEDALQGLLAWYYKIVNDISRPEIEWGKSQDNTLTVDISNSAGTAVLWSATNHVSKDFRLETFGPNWYATPLSVTADGKIEIPLTPPEAGWSGYFVEVTIEDIPGLVEKYTTPVFVLPNTDPFDLEEPAFTPKSSAIWLQELAGINNGLDENPQLIDSFPIRNIGGETVLTVNDAYDVLANSINDERTHALKACLATRLNIKDGQLGWYSKPNRSSGFYLWQWWNYADYFYRARMYSLSEYICSTMNM